MPLTEAQRLAFMKGREKRMANIEKKKLEMAEMEQFGEQIVNAPEKPKVTRKPRKTKAVTTDSEAPEEKKAVDVKIDIDLGTSISKEETTPPIPNSDEKKPDKDVSISSSEPHHPAVSAATQIEKPSWFDEDAFANKIVNMMMEKGIGLPTPPAPEEIVKKKRKTATSKKPITTKETEFQEVSQAPTRPAPTTSFAWM